MASSPITAGHFRLEYQDARVGRRFDRIHMPSQWFALRYPEHAERWGAPFMEHTVLLLRDSHPEEEVNPYAINDDFFAAILGGDKQFGHSVIFYQPEQTFYFKDYDGWFYPVSEQKLTCLLSNLLIRCAQEMPRKVHIHNLFVEFRKPEQLRSIILKAKSMLAVSAEFFSELSPHQRREGPELIVRTAKVFVADSIIQQAGQLAIQAAQDRFHDFCFQRNVKGLKKRETRPLLIDVVQEQFGCGLRHDLMQNGKKVRGWTGIALGEELTAHSNN